MANSHNNQRGSVIIFALLMMVVMLAVGLTLIGIFLPKVKSIAGTVNSTVALFAADSASEMCLYETRKNQTVSRNGFILTQGESFTIASLSAQPVDVTGDCKVLGQKFRFRAVGTFRGVSRALEVGQ